MIIAGPGKPLPPMCSKIPRAIRVTQARLREAEILGLLGDWQGSLNTYKSIANQGAAAGSDYQVRYGIGRAYFKLGRYELASEVLESLTASDLPEPLRFSTNALLAEIALKKGEIEAGFYAPQARLPGSGRRRPGVV